MELRKNAGASRAGRRAKSQRRGMSGGSSSGIKAACWSAAAAVVCVSAFSDRSVDASALYYDTSAATGLQPGAGTWTTNTGTLDWSTAASGTALTNWTDGSDAIFETGNTNNNTLTVVGTVMPNSIQVLNSDGSTGYATAPVTGTNVITSGGAIILGTGGIVISGGGGLTIGATTTFNLNGSQTWELSSNTGSSVNFNSAINDYTGSTTLTLDDNSGTSGKQANFNGAVSLAALTLQQSTGNINYYFNNNLTLTGALTVNNHDYNAVFAGTNVLGSLIAGSGTVLLNGVGASKTGLGVTSSTSVSGTAAFSGANATVATTTVTGATTLSGGTLTLTGTNSFNGGLTTSGGVLAVNAAAGLGLGSSALTINGGTLNNTSGAAVTTANNSPITLGGNFSYSTSAGTAANNLNLGNGALTNSANETITLYGADSLTFGGVMTNTLAGNQTITVNNGAGATATTAVSFGGYALSNSSTSYTDTIAGSGIVNITGPVTNGGSATASGLTHSGTGTLILSGSNSYSGGTTISSGTIQLSGANATLGSINGALTVNTGGALDLNGVNTGVGTFTGTTGTVLNSGTGTNVTFTIGNNNGTGGSFAGVIEDNAGVGGTVAVTKVGTGSLGLGGTNSYSGTTTVSGGTLAIAVGGSIANSSSANVASGAALTFANGGTPAAITANGTVAFGGTSALNTTPTLSGSGGTGVVNYTNTLAAGNTLNFSGTNSFLGINNVTNGTTLNLTGVGSNNTFTQEFSQLSSANQTSVTNFLSGTYTFNTGGSSVYNNNFGTVSIAGATVVFAGGLSFFDGGVGGTTNLTSGLLQVKGSFNTINQNYANYTNSVINLNVSGGVFDFSSTSPANLNFGDDGTGNGSKSNVTSDFFNISGSGKVQVGVTGTGGGNLVLGDTAPYIQTALALSGGTLLVNGSIQANGAPASTGGTKFNFTGGVLTALGVNMTNLGSNDGTNSATSGTLYNGGGTLYPGGRNTAGTLVSGKTTLTGNYQGDNNTSDVLDFNIGGTAASGAFQDTGVGSFSLLSVSGGVAVDGALNVTVLSGYTPSSTSQLYTVVTAGTAVTGAFTNLTLVSGSTYSGTTQDGGYTYEAIFNDGGNNITLTDFSAVPEPTSLGLLGLGGLALMRRRRKTISGAANRVV